jgi:hypothetical protein
VILVQEVPKVKMVSANAANQAQEVLLVREVQWVREVKRVAVVKTVAEVPTVVQVLMGYPVAAVLKVLLDAVVLWVPVVHVVNKAPADAKARPARAHAKRSYAN